MRKVFLLAVIFYGSTTYASDIIEYCSKLSASVGIGMCGVAAEPHNLFSHNNCAKAVINGSYYAKGDLKTEGVAYISSDINFGTRREADIGGFFAVKSDRTVYVGETLPRVVTDDPTYTRLNEEDYYMVIGTRPLLVTGGAVCSQVGNYGTTSSFRSAIGMKKDNNICFVISSKPTTMSGWASILKNNGYLGALNLDGGPESELAYSSTDIKKGTEIDANGAEILNSSTNTKLLIYFYDKSCSITDSKGFYTWCRSLKL